MERRIIVIFYFEEFLLTFYIYVTEVSGYSIVSRKSFIQNV